jgi:hypothetical protein
VRLRRTAQLLDAAVRIPFTPWRIGIDGLIGLVPGIGDLVGALLSASIVFEAMRLGAPAAVLSRMLLNVGIDAIIGEIPVLGDIFDIGFKANLRNVALVERHLADARGAAAASRGFLWLCLMALLLIVVGTVALAAVMLVGLWRWMAG